MNLKKTLTMGLTALMMVTALSIPSFAANPTKDVTGSYVANATTPVMSMAYSWGDMKFTYSESSKGVWNPETHTYDTSGGTSGGWAPATTGSNKVTVVNHSNVAIKVTYTFTPSLEGITASLGTSDGNGTIASAEGTEVASAPQKDFYLNITGGSLTSGQTDVKLGTLELSYEAA